MSGAELSDADKTLIFRQDILPDLIADEEDRTLPEVPHFVVLGGQPGSGKTGVLAATFRDLQTQGATWAINADDFAAYHPRYGALQDEHGIEAADMVRGVTGQWIKSTIEEAQRRRVNVVFESTMRQSGVVQDTLRQFRAQGYITHAKALAVRPMESWLGNHFRREQLAAAGALSRLATRESHDAAVLGSVETLRDIQKLRLVDRVTIVDRSDRPLYESSLTETGWSNPVSAAEQMEALRLLPMDQAEASRHMERWEKVEQLARARHERSSTGSRPTGSPGEAREDLAQIAAARASDAFGLVMAGSLPELRATRDLPAVGEALLAYKAACGVFSQLAPKDPDLQRELIHQARDALQARLAAGQVKNFIDTDRISVRAEEMEDDRDEPHR